MEQHDPPTASLFSARTVLKAIYKPQCGSPSQLPVAPPLGPEFNFWGHAPFLAPALAEKCARPARESQDDVRYGHALSSQPFSPSPQLTPTPSLHSTAALPLEKIIPERPPRRPPRHPRRFARQLVLLGSPKSLTNAPVHPPRVPASPRPSSPLDSVAMLSNDLAALIGFGCEAVLWGTSVMSSLPSRDRCSPEFPYVFDVPRVCAHRVVYGSLHGL